MEPKEGDPLDRVFDALQSPYRRQLLCALLEAPPDTEEPTHASSVLADNELCEIDPEAYHVHIPKLVEMGYVEWDPRQNDICRGPRFAELQPMVEIIRTNQELLLGE